MAMTPEEEYRAAFNDGAEEQPPVDEAPPEEMAAEAPAEEAPPAEEAAAEPTDNAPSESAAEGTGDETPAVAVVVAPDDGDNEPVEEQSVDWKQKYKTLQGKYDAEIAAKRGEELAAREAALSAQESGQVDQYADGGEVAEIPSEEAGEPEAVESAEQSTAVARIRAKAMELMQSGQIEAALQEAIDNYGEEFVALSAALGGLMFDDMAQPYLNDMNSSLDSLVDEVVTAFQSRDRETILDAHDDLDQIVENPEFQAWVDGLPEEEKARATEIVEAGSPRSVIGLLKEFKAGATKDKSPDDIWAEDAAEGVKSSAPVQLPMRTGAAPEDEYKAAWASM